MPLTYFDRGTSGTQLEIISGRAIVGNLWKATTSVGSGGSPRWAWSWHAGPAKGPQQHGAADTIGEAKAKIEEQWRMWLEAAGLTEER